MYETRKSVFFLEFRPILKWVASGAPAQVLSAEDTSLESLESGDYVSVQGRIVKGAKRILATSLIRVTPSLYTGSHITIDTSLNKPFTSVTIPFNVCNQKVPLDRKVRL